MNQRIEETEEPWEAPEDHGITRRTVPSPRRAGPTASRQRLTAMIEGLAPDERGPAAVPTPGVGWLRFSPSPRAVLGLLALAVLAVLALVLFVPRGEQQAPRIAVAADGSASPLELGSADPGSDAAPAAGAPGATGTPGATAAASGGEVAVHVVGAVKAPGLQRLPAGALTAEAIQAAGGPTEEAGLEGINLAAPVQSGQQIRVPTREEAAAQAAAPANPSGTAAAGAAESGAGPGSAGAGAASGERINLNTATAEQLETLPRVGPKLAQRILDYRQAHGAFASVAELDAVPGIGEAMLAALEPLVTV